MRTYVEVSFFLQIAFILYYLALVVMEDNAQELKKLMKSVLLSLPSTIWAGYLLWFSN
jgi:hypothetical protein